MPSMTITELDQITWHDQKPTHRPVNHAVSNALAVEDAAWDAVDHISTAIFADERWCDLDEAGMYEAHQLMTTCAKNASDAVLEVKRSR